MDATDVVGIIGGLIVAYVCGIKRGRAWERDVWLSLWR